MLREGTKQYATAGGATRTVPLYRLLTPKQIEARAKEAEARAKEAEVRAWEERWKNENRTWTDKTGTYKVEAVYDDHVGDGNIRLLRQDKSEIVIHLSKLSDADRRKAIELREAAKPVGKR